MPKQLHPFEKIISLQELFLDCSRLELGLQRFARESHRWLRELDLKDFLLRTLGKDAVGQLLAEFSGWYHLGYLAPPEAEKIQVLRIAKEAGFTDTSAVFQSEIVARELGEKLGLPAVPTTIVKCHDCSGEGPAVGLEAFLAEGSTPHFETWRCSSVGLHLGVGLRTHEAVWRAMDLCASAGFQAPSFLRGGPAVNQAEDILIIYADGDHHDRPVRLEFYHNKGEGTRSPWQS